MQTFKRIYGNSENQKVYIDFRILDLSASQVIRNHSPDGFSWGYSGSGPSQLALAILLHLTNDTLFSSTWYQEYKKEFVSSWDSQKDFDINLEDTYKWISKKRALSRQGSGIEI
jgi:hypothetical protein